MTLTKTASAYAFNTDVVRNEWGFRGYAITDAISRSYMVGHISSRLQAGTNSFCLDRSFQIGQVAANEIRETDDGDYFNLAVRAAKDYFYMASRTNLINGMHSDAVLVSVTPWWQTALVVAIVVLAVLTAGSIIMTVYIDRKEHRK